jgi:4-hydroxyproline epimerase
MTIRSISVIDSHTGGEPTRLVMAGGPDLGEGPLEDRVQRFRSRFDDYRSAIVNEPRGSDPLVGALLVKPHRPGCDFGVIYFNNVGYLGMCGHGTIGLIASLKFAGKLTAGAFKLDTPVGAVDVQLRADGRVSVANVVSYRSHAKVSVDVPGMPTVTGDIAWGGNWFFLVTEHGQTIDLKNVEALTDFSWRVRSALNAQGHPLVDHVELFGPGLTPGAHSRNFVLCPGKAYDRSPCGTGTSAKLACLAADGKLREGDTWVQESLIGSRFEAAFKWHDQAQGQVVPTITGSAFITGESALRLDPDDPFCFGIRA